jgi:drug/metabolite transporter (DMT)-like permease
MNRVLLAHITLFFVNVIYALNYLVAKGIMPDYMGPSGFIVYRVSGALLLFLLISRFKLEKIERQDWIKLALAGLFGIAINQLLFFNGLSLTSPINASIIMTSNPIMVLIVSHLIIKERITRDKLVGIVLGGTGAVLLLLSSKQGGSGHANFWGDVMVFINALSYGVYLVIAKPLLQKYSPKTVITYAFLFGWIIVTPVGFSQAKEVVWNTLPIHILLGIGFVIIFTTFLVYLMNINALKWVSPSVASTYIYLQPVLAGLFAWLVDRFTSNSAGYSQDITLYKVAITFMIFLGVYLVGRSGLKKKTDKTPLKKVA